MMPSSFAQTSRGPLGRFSVLRLRLTGFRGSKKSGWSRPRLEALEERFLPTVSVLQNFAGINSNQNAFLLTPPDNMMAVGPTAVVASVNTAITLTNKSGTPVRMLLELNGAVTFTDLENDHSVVATIRSVRLR